MSNIVADQQLADLALSRLAFIRAPRGFGIYASAGLKYRYAVYGRDSLEAGEDLLHIDPSITREVILTMAYLQGSKLKLRTEEEPGKIHHEFRALRLGEVPVGIMARIIFRYLGSQWGGEHQELCYYGSVDSTPLFVRLVDRYVTVYGPSILDEIITDRRGNKAALREHVRSAAEWVKRRVDESPWHLLEFQRFNPRGLPYQAWKDSGTGYIHLDGSVANADGGIASVEVQGYAYDALLAASTLVARSPQEAKQYEATARAVQKNTLDLLWTKHGKQSFFCMGLDRGEQGETRQIQTFTSNSAALLDSGLLLDLPDKERLEYASSIAKVIMGHDFLTEVGVRMRALRHADLVDFADYHGSLVSWPKETYDIAKGLRRHGYVREATELEERLLAAAARSGEFYEFYHVSRDGKVEYRYGSHRREIQSSGRVNVPEPSQAWTIAAILSIIHSRGHL